MPMKLPPDDLTLRECLEIIVEWRMPSSGSFSPTGYEYSYESAYGSNGARDYIRRVGSRALELIS